MRIEAHNRLSEPKSFKATSVIIYDNMNNPICFAIEISPGQYHCSHAGDSDFQSVLDLWGLDKLVVHKINAKDLPPVDIKDLRRR